ncbi:MAG: RapZ C-terminal domain-containing protein, partial [Candidatus Dormibacteria bacterium]
ERMVESQLRPDARSRPLIRLAVGCTGGRHRSVALAEELGRRLTRRGLRAVVWHRDLAV